MPDTDFTPALEASLGERMRIAGLQKENARAWAEIDRLRAALKCIATDCAELCDCEDVAVGDRRSYKAIGRIAMAALHIQKGGE